MSLDRHRHKKSLGQHFLRDRTVVEQILRAIAPRPGEPIVEIGPGAGALTLPLLERHRALTVIEFDRDLVGPLAARAAALGELSIIQADVLTVDFTALAAGRMLRLVGNLPYNISSPILFHVLQHAAVIADMHFMLQLEVVERMAAAPGGRQYGRLSVMLQAVCEVEPLFEVPPSAFDPPPKVDSAVVRLRPRPAAGMTASDPVVFEQVVRQAFAQRRKTLRNSWAGLVDPATMLALGIDPGNRAERLPLQDFIAVAQRLQALRAAT